MLQIETDPSKKLGYIPEYYLSNSTIKEYEIFDSVTSIGREAFYGCKSLTSVEIGDNVTTIDSAAFCRSGIKTTILGNNPLLHIAPNAFYKSDLETIEFKGTKKEVKKNGIGSISLKEWKETPTLKKIVCTDGVLKLRT